MIPLAILIGLASAAVALLPLTAAAVTGAVVVAVPIGWWLLREPNHWVGAFLGAAMLLPPLPIALGNSGPHPALAFAAAGLGTGLVRLRYWTPRLDPLARSMLVFYGVVTGSVLAAAYYSGWEIAAASFARVILFGFSFYVYFFLTQGPGAGVAFHRLHALRWMFRAAFVAATFACIDFYFQLPAPAGFGPQFVWLDSGVFRRAQGLFYEASTLGNFCAFFLVMIAVAAVQPRQSRVLSWKAMLVAGPVLSAALVFSYSRASVGALVAALMALAWLKRGQFPMRRWLLILTGSLAAGTLAVYLLFPSFARIYGTRFLLSFENLFTDTNSILSGRLDSWSTLIALLAENPLYMLFGVGYKTLPYSGIAGRPLVVDNMYLTLLAETGIVGLAAFLWMNGRIIETSYRAATGSASLRSFFGTWMFCFWVGELVQMLSGDLLTYWRVLPLYFWVLANTQSTDGQ